MTRKRLTIAVLSLFPLSGTLGLLSACNTAAGFGRDMAAAGDWLSRQLGGASSTTAGGAAPASAGASAASGTSASRAGMMTEEQVRRDLQDHGYSNVSDLHRSGNDWAGSAVDSTGKPVHVVVDRNGVIVIVP